MLKKTTSFFSIGLSLICLMTTNQADAQSIGIELGIFADGNGIPTDNYGNLVDGEDMGGSSFTLSPLLAFETPVSDDWALAAEWGFVFTDFSPDTGDGDSTFRIGNPFLGAAYSLMNDDIDLTIGCGIGLPLASVPDDDSVAGLAYWHASTIRGWWDFWLWRARVLGIVFPLQLILDELPLFNIRGEAAAAGLVAVNDDDSDILFQLGGEAGLRLGVAELGARLQFVWIPTSDGDNAQTAVEPYVLFDLKPGFVRLGLLMNLDKPLGFAFDADGYWGVRLAAGFEF
jgi:hypothetical protein